MKILALLLFCSLAQAQTWDYSNTLSGGTLTASVTVDNGLLTSYSAEFNAANGIVLALDTSYSSDHIDAWDGTSQSGNKITIGPTITFAFGENIFHYGNLTMDFGGGTDTVIFTNSSWNPVCGGDFGAATSCLIQANGTSGTWTEQGVMTAQAIAAPEIDPIGGIGAFLLLAGGLAVIRGRKAPWAVS